MVRTFIKRFFIGLNILICVVYLLACLGPFINTANWPIFGFLTLGLPYLVILLIFSVFFWLIIKPKWALLPLLILAAGYKQLGVLFAFNPNVKFAAKKAAGGIRLISWNVGNMYGLSHNAEKKKHNRLEVADVVLKQQADVVCLQEFNHSTTRSEADNIGLFSAIYPYHYFSKDVNKDSGFYQYGSIIFSKLPIVDSGRIQYPGRPESLIYADLLLGSDTIRIYTSHLQSFKFSKSDYSDIDKIKQEGDKTLAASKNIFQKMRQAFIERGKQAAVVRTELDSCTLPSIMCGDFNDVPGSYTYFHIRGARQDAFLQKGFALGSTFNSLAPALRIDHIMPDKHFTVQQFDMVDEDLSDHIMLVSDVSLKK